MGGPGDPVDWLLEMRRFPDGALFGAMADRGELDEAMLLRLADRIAASHANAETIPEIDGEEAMRSVVKGNGHSLGAFPALFPGTEKARLIADQLALVKTHGRLLSGRGRAGRIRHVHGDLHLANIALVDGRPTLFDCLEFDRRLASIDILYDLAFLLMDLWQRDLRGEANIVFNRYWDVAGEDEDGVALMPLFLSVRATIRAHVLAASAARTGDHEGIERAKACFALAARMLERAEARLVAIGGLSGSGKSTLARVIGGAFDPAPGARILRSDVLRKRLAGVPPETALPSSSYSRESSAAVYAEIARRAGAVAATGHSVIVDAVFAEAAHRTLIEQTAIGAGVRFDGVWLDASIDERLSRVEGRRADASDADGPVVRAQEGLGLGAIEGWRTVSTRGSPSQARERLLRALRLPSRKDEARRTRKKPRYS